MNRRPSLLQLAVGTLIHKVPYGESRRCLDLIEGHGLSITYTELSAHHLAGGRMFSWIEGVVYAQERGVKMNPQNGAARDLVEAHTSRRTLREHIQGFEAVGVRDLDSAPLKVEQLKKPNQPPEPMRAKGPHGSS